MNKNTMWKYYRKLSAAHTYILGFEIGHEVYMITRKHVGQFLSYEKASRGQGMGLRLRLKSADRKRLAKKAIHLGSAEELKNSIYNKGENFERMVFEYYGRTWEKDTVPFTESGDIQINGIEIQIKFDGATFTVEKTLKRQMEMMKGR